MLFKITIHRVVGYFEQRFCAEEEENTETVYVNLRKTDDSGTWMETSFTKSLHKLAIQGRVSKSSVQYTHTDNYYFCLEQEATNQYCREL